MIRHTEKASDLIYPYQDDEDERGLVSVTIVRPQGGEATQTVRTLIEMLNVVCTPVEWDILREALTIEGA